MKPAELLRTFIRPAILGLLMLATLSASRLLLMAVLWGRVSATDGVGFILLQGLRFDLILIGLLLGPVFLFKPFFHTSTALAKAGSWLWPLYLGLAVALAFQVEASTLSFIREYDSRPNFIYVEYLSYPQEVLGTLLGAHFLELTGVSSLVVMIFLGTTYWLRKDPGNGQKLSWKTCVWSFPLVALAVVMAVRSTLDHRPVNPSVAAFSTDSMVNQLALNSPYSLLYALYEHHRDGKETKLHYGDMEDAQAVALVLADSGIQPAAMVRGSEPTLHHHQASFPASKPRNLVIILEESFGAEFVGRLGGKNLAPRLEHMAGQGIWFEQLYATGTRSVRGIEAVVTGFTPSQRSSVVKLMDTQDHFFTLGSVLQQQGYRTSFIYGGEAHFDNMRGFFLNNGFQTVVDEKDYDDPEFRGTWGVSDEDLFKKADEMFSEPGSQPFFSLLFTSSNHEPFDIPAGRVVPEPGEQGPRETAVKYADYALGEFLQRAQTSAYWKDTVFLIIADHNSRVYGNQLIPIERFHIPGLIVGGPVVARVIPGISSQIDMLPTLLSLIGASADIPAIGHDLTRAEFYQGAGRAMMQFNSIEALMVPGKVVVLRPELPPAHFLYAAGKPLLPDPVPNPDLEQMALAYFAIGPAMIRNHWYADAPLAAAGAH